MINQILKKQTFRDFKQKYGPLCIKRWEPACDNMVQTILITIFFKVSFIHVELLLFLKHQTKVEIEMKFIWPNNNNKDGL